MSGATWRSLLLRIGDRCPEYGGSSDQREHVETCFGALWRDFSDSKDTIFELLLQCAEQLPHKIPFYGVLVGLINLENEDFGKRVVDRVLSSFQDALLAEDCDRIRILMRLLTGLMASKVILPSSIIVIFETVLSCAANIIDEDTGSTLWQPCADFYVYCIMSSLPWGGLELSEQAPDDLKRVMISIQSYMRFRKQFQDAAFSVFEADETNIAKDYLEDLWDRLLVLEKRGWKATSVPNPQLEFEAQLVDGKSHSLLGINCPLPSLISSNSTLTEEQERHKAVLKYPQRLRRLYIFPSDKAENMQPIDRFVVEEYVLDVLLYFNGCRKECAFYLVGLPVPFRYEYLMAETIFSQLLLLPQPPFKPIYYTLVIIDLCKALPGAFPAVVVGAVRALFDRISDMDMECRTRLILWFSHHLSNFQFIWPWQEWAYVKDLPIWAPQRVFVQEVLNREVRLSYYEKIQQSIETAGELEELLPPKGGAEFKYQSVDVQEPSDGHMLSKELNSMIRGKKNFGEIIMWVEENIITKHGSSFALEVVSQTLLDIGSRSFTHLITVLERFGQVIAKLCPDEESQLLLMNEVSSYWKNNTQMIAITIDRMMSYRLISNLAIVKWVFSPSNVEQFHVSDRPWEILKNAVSKTYNRVADLRKEIQLLEKGLRNSERATENAVRELADTESLHEMMDGQPAENEKSIKLRRLKAAAERTKREEAATLESWQSKNALFAQDLEVNKRLLILLYKSFAGILTERLPPVSDDGEVPNLRAGASESESIPHDLEEAPSAMELDSENGTDSSKLNGQKSQYNIGEQEQWCLCTLGHLKSFSRQYATEIWSHIELLDKEVFAGSVHPLILRAVYSGLGRPYQ